MDAPQAAVGGFLLGAHELRLLLMALAHVVEGRIHLAEQLDVVLVRSLAECQHHDFLKNDTR